MSISSPDGLVTAESLSSLAADGQWYEIVNGVLVEEPPMGTRESRLEAVTMRLLEEYIDSASIRGLVLPASARLRLRRDPDTVRGPDLSFVAQERVPPGPLPTGHLDAVPDFAVEIISASNSYYEIEGKISDYLRFGVKMIWVIDPESRSAYMYTPDGKVERIGADGELRGGEGVPGFAVKLSDALKAVGIETESPS